MGCGASDARPVVPATPCDPVPQPGQGSGSSSQPARSEQSTPWAAAPAAGGRRRRRRSRSVESPPSGEYSGSSGMLAAEEWFFDASGIPADFWEPHVPQMAWSVEPEDERQVKKPCKGISAMDIASCTREFCVDSRDPSVRGPSSTADTRSQKGAPCLFEDDCALCLECFSDGDTIRELRCGHSFHARCVDHWLTGWGSTCPMCCTPVCGIDQSGTGAAAERLELAVIPP
eukprot:TRINITY_DN23047_c0_g1_i1.p2 TRINITY_DN23047_c0_g1~~TRINITY_DN23047_c0_g1_i1.p2  ORF type:complete len:230 (+),score=40.19 TRINITY_DN23047_c0_g1_i1:102-791(+)